MRIKLDLHTPSRSHAVPISFPSRSHAVPLPRPSHSPKAGGSPTCRLRTADANSHMPCRSHAALCGGLERPLSERHIRGTSGERHGNGVSCFNQTQLHCVNQIWKTQSKPIAERHGRGTAWYVWISLKSYETVSSLTTAVGNEYKQTRRIWM
jgi:hypothetical protein